MCKEMFLCTFGLKEWAVWNWMLRKKSENHLYSHTSPHYGRAAPSAPQNVPGLIHKNMSIVTRDTKLKLQIPQSRNYSVLLCEYLLVTALDLQAVLLSLAQIQHHCATRQSCVVTISLFMTSPPLTHTKLNILDFGMQTMADLRQMNLPPMCNIT